MSEKNKEANYIELVSMLFLAGVAVAVILPGVGTVQEIKKHRGYFDTCRQNLMTINEAVDKHIKLKEGRAPERLSDLLQGKPPFLTELPRCPAAVENKRGGYEDPKAYVVKQGALPRYTIFCIGTNHQDIGLKKDEPYFDSNFGLKPTAGEIRNP